MLLNAVPPKCSLEYPLLLLKLLFEYSVSDMDIDYISDMASSDTQDWQLERHPGIFEKIMLMIGLNSLESLDNCRQVCRSCHDHEQNLGEPDYDMGNNHTEED